MCHQENSNVVLFMWQCAHLETKVFRMESRFLVVLLKLQEGRRLERHREAITTLVTDALRENGRDVLELSPSRCVCWTVVNPPYSMRCSY